MPLLTGKREEGKRQGGGGRERIHCLGLSYRDMKTASVLVKNENGECVIGDLGFAMILDSKQLASTRQVLLDTGTILIPIVGLIEALHHNDVIQHACENSVIAITCNWTCFDWLLVLIYL